MRSCNGTLALKWKYKRDVYIISTKHGTAKVTEQGEDQFNPSLKPKRVIEYNKGISGIDRQGQMLVCFPVIRKYAEGYRKLFFYAFHIALFNSYILFNKMSSRKKYSYAEYRIITQNVPLQEYERRFATETTRATLGSSFQAH